MPDEQRFVLGICYQAGPDPRIKRGVDGGRDWFSKAELERACWSYMRSGCPQINAFHVDGTEDCAEPVESFIWRWDDWDVGDGIVVKDGDWCLGAILSPRMWELHKAGQVNAFSPEGTAIRRRVQKEGAVALTKGSADSAPDEDEPTGDGDFTQLFGANVPKVALVGQGANGIPRFLMSKQEGAVGLLDAAYVRDLLAKSEPPDDAPSVGEAVTMTGSPTAIASLMRQVHEAPVRKSPMADAQGDVEKAEASTASMNDRPDSDFAYIESGGTKDEHGRTVPRSLRHFPIYDAAHVRNALSRAPQSPFGDKAMPKIRAAAKKFGIDVSKEQAAVSDATNVAKDMSAGMPTDDGIDGMDPTVVLAAPDEGTPGDPNDPGSPAWEAIDAATACKWTAILARARSALGVMADRENLEAATADPDDAYAACDLQDAACAIDYAISILAPFAVDEQAESDEGAAALEMVGKALAGFDAAALDTVESLGAVRKAGRVLSSANEAAIRGAVESLQKVLASLPAAPTTDEKGAADAVAKTANEEPDMATPTTAEDVTAASGQQPAMGAASAEPKPVAGAVVTDVAKTAEAAPAPVAKADKPPQVAVYDANGNLVGVADPADITMIAAAKAPAANTDDATPDEPAAPAAEAPDAPPTDMTPAPAASVGTPADAVPADDDSVAKAAQPTENTEAPHDVLKSSDIRDLVKAAITEQSARQGELIKSLEDRNRELEERNEALAKQAAELEDRLTKVENQPAVMAIASNGAIPPAHLMRGQDRGAPIGSTQGQILKARLAASDDAIEKKQIADEMQGLAIAEFQKLQQGVRAR